ncbi:MAG: hypothetical protein ABFD69_01890 [Candidatus Sumerlaeia bacterium]
MTTFRQIVALTRLSMRRLMFTRFMFSNLLLASLPVIMLVVIAVSMKLGNMSGPGLPDLHQGLERMLRFFYLHFIIFFVATVSGFAIVRQDLDDRTLHYIVLAPVKRWAVTISKFIAFWILSAAILLASYWATYLSACLIVAGPSATVRDLFGEAGWFGNLVRESCVIVLALTTYGAIGMAMGSVFKSLVFAPILWVWEATLPWLPAGLKLLALSHYFQSMLPVKVTEKQRMLEILADPASLTLSLTVLACVTAISIAIALLVNLWRECAYIEEQA